MNYCIMVSKKKDEQEYLNLIRDVLQEGVLKNDRTNTGIISHFGHQMRFNIEHYFPLLTTKNVFKRYYRRIIVVFKWSN